MPLRGGRGQRTDDRCGGPGLAQRRGYPSARRSQPRPCGRAYPVGDHGCLLPVVLPAEVRLLTPMPIRWAATAVCGERRRWGRLTAPWHTGRHNPGERQINAARPNVYKSA